MKKLFLLFLLPMLVFAYTPPSYDAADLVVSTTSYSTCNPESCDLILGAATLVDPCTDGSGNCTITCGSGANISTTLNMNGYSLKFNGTGVAKVYAQVSNYSAPLLVSGCTVVIEPGGRLLG